MKKNKIFIIQLITCCLFTVKLSAQWVQLQTPVNGPFHGMYFFNSNTGYFVGADMSILKTTNGGSNWLIQFSGTPSQNFMDVHFINYNTGFVIQYYNIVYKTTNGGNNWDNVFNANTQLTSICFPSTDTGYISGMNYAITLKTTNSGLNWIEMPAPNAYSFSIYFLNNITGYLCCAMHLFKTTNG